MFQKDRVRFADDIAANMSNPAAESIFSVALANLWSKRMSRLDHLLPVPAISEIDFFLIIKWR